MKKIAYVGIDYHLNSLTVAVLIEGAHKIKDTIRILKLRYKECGENMLAVKKLCFFKLFYRVADQYTWRKLGLE